MCFLKYMLSYFHDPDEPCIDVHIVDSSNVLAMTKARIKHRSGTTNSALFVAVVHGERFTC